jgi:hypothetical protein
MVRNPKRILLVAVVGLCLMGCQTVYDILAPTFTVVDALSGFYDDGPDDSPYSADEIREHRREVSSRAASQ